MEAAGFVVLLSSERGNAFISVGSVFFRNDNEKDYFTLKSSTSKMSAA